MEYMEKNKFNTRKLWSKLKNVLIASYVKIYGVPLY